MQSFPVPLISVIINSYNYGRFIDDAIRSVLNQSIASEFYELIVVDDGSTDDTRDRVAKYSDSLTYIYKPNGGQASALNAGLAVARGEFVALLDADDYWSTDKLKKVLDEFSKDAAVDVVYHPMQLVNNEGNILGYFPQWFTKAMHGGPIGSMQLNFSMLGSATSGISWRRSALECIVPIPNDFRICADAYLMALAQLVARKVGLVAEPLVHYRMHDSNQWARFNPQISSCQARTEEIGNYYSELAISCLEKKAIAIGLKNCLPLHQVTYARIRSKVVQAVQTGGRVHGVRVIWSNRALLWDFPFRYRIFKLSLLLLGTFLPQGKYILLREKCLNSFVWHKVCHHIVPARFKEKPL